MNAGSGCVVASDVIENNLIASASDLNVKHNRPERSDDILHDLIFYADQ